MLRTAVTSAILLLAALASSLPAQAQREDDLEDEEDAGDREAARKLIDSGDRHLVRGDRLLERGKKVQAQDAYLAALADYRAAHEAFPSPQIYFAIALAEKRLGRYIEALEHFDRLLEELDEVPERLRAEVDRHVNELKQNLGVIFFRIEPEGATIEIDGTAIGKSPLNRPHYVVPGEHLYRISRPGFEPLEGTIEIEAGDVREDEMALQRKAAPPAKPDDDDLPPPIEVKEPDKTQLYIGLGMTGGFAAGAAVTGFLALSRHDTFTDESASPDERADARDSGRNLALITDVLVIGALASATYTAYYYFAVYRQGGADQEQPPPGEALHLVPTASPDGVGLAVGGRF